MYDPRLKSLLKEILDDLEIGFDADFGIRLSTNFDAIYGLFERLYPDRDDLAIHIRTLVERLAAAYRQRSPVLKQMDIERESDYHWFLSEKLVGMMLYVDRFCGDLKNFKTKLSYFKDLGVNLVHLMPLLKCPRDNNDGGYAVSDFRKVNPELGTIEDIRDIADTFRKEGMCLMLDLAVNHTSDEHKWAKAALKGDPKYQAYYYMFDDRRIPDQFEASLPEVFPETAPGNFTNLKELDKWVMTVFHEYQWDLNYTNPEVFIEMLDNLLFLANQGIDVIRLDALAFLWKRIGTQSQNLEEAHLIIQAFKACAQVVAPGVLFLAEAIVAPNEIIGYFGHPKTVSNECDMAYNATLMTLLWESIATKNNKLLHASLNNIPAKPFGRTWLNYVRCHDDIGLGYEDLHASWAGYDARLHRKFVTDFLAGSISWSFARGAKFMEDRKNGDARISGSLASLAGLELALDKKDDTAIEMAIKRITMLNAVILSYGGIPIFYMGDEIGMTNDYSYLEDELRKDDNRWMHRPEMNWEREQLKTKKGTVENRIYKTLQHLVALRKSSPEFADHNNTVRVDCRNEHLFAFIRQRDGYRSFCVFNLNDHPELLYKDVLDGNGFETALGVRDRISGKVLNFLNYNVMMEPYQSFWISSI